MYESIVKLDTFTCVTLTFFVFLKEVKEGRNRLATFNCSAILGILFIPNKSNDICTCHAERHTRRKTREDFSNYKYINHHLISIILC